MPPRLPLGEDTRKGLDARRGGGRLGRREGRERECAYLVHLFHRQLSAACFFTPPEETEHGTRPGGRGPGGVPGGVGSKNRGGACARIQRRVYAL